MPMNAPGSFAIDGDIAIWKPAAALSLDRAIRLIEAAIGSARENGLRKMLVDTTGLDGFEPPSVPARHELARLWAGAAGGVLRIAFVARPEMIDPQKFGVIVAKNFGADVDVFASEADALAWLRRG